MHRYLVRLENSRKHFPADTLRVLIDMRKESDEFGVVVKNLRITEKALEFDLFVPNDDAKKSTLGKLTKEFGKLLNEKDLEEQASNDVTPSQYGTKEEVMKLAIELFNEQRYWECHETVEQIWRREKDKAEKDVQQGFILAASALVHFQKNENDVCLGMMPRTLSKLEHWMKPAYYDLNVKRLKEKLEEIMRTRNITPFTV